MPTRTIPMPSSSKPVSSALYIVSGDGGEPIRHTARVIDSIHRDGILPEISIVREYTGGSNGRYSYFTQQDNGQFFRVEKIRIAPGIGEPHFTSAHEIGHLLDHQAIDKVGKYASVRSGIMSEWRDAVMSSEAVTNLRALSSVRALEALDVSGIMVEIPINKKYVNYLLKKEEIWARSYAQYIAANSSDFYLELQLAERINAFKGRVYTSQWNDKDFEPIATAIDTLFRKLGWIL